MIALYPGAFKPPHRGHFEVIKSLLKGTHKGKVYDVGNYKDIGTQVLGGDSDEVEPINKVLVFIGGGERNGITKEESMAVWKIYAKYLPGMQLIDGDKNPLSASKEYAKINNKEKYYAITGIRSEEDMVDLRRVNTFKNLDNVQGLVIPGGVNSNIRATDFRRAILSGNLDEVLDFFPKELSRKEILSIMNMLKASIVAEMMQEKLNNELDTMFTEETKQEEGFVGTATAPQNVIRSADKVGLIDLYNELNQVVGDRDYNVVFNQNHILIKPKNEDEKTGFDYTPYMASVLEYMIDDGMNILPLPEVKIKKDITESTNFFGRTAYYNPEDKEVVLYVEGRHPKDVMRSFVHEMIHHIQNIEERLGNIGTTNTNEDAHLLEIEKEAYLRGNITFRNWEDSIKN